MEATTAMISTQIRELVITSWALHQHKFNFVFTYYSLMSFLIYGKSKLIKNVFNYKYVAETYLDVMNFGR